LKRAIQSQLEDPLAKAILEGRFVAGDTIRVACDSGMRVACDSGIMRFDVAEKNVGVAAGHETDS